MFTVEWTRKEGATVMEALARTIAGDTVLAAAAGSDPDSHVATLRASYFALAAGLGISDEQATEVLRDAVEFVGDRA